MANSSPLIHLAAVQDLHLLKTLFGVIVIPKAVYEEVVTEGEGQAGAQEVSWALGEWITVPPIRDRRAVDLLLRREGLHRGESEAIALAQELKAEAILLDDRHAVGYAKRSGLRVIRTPAIYTTAKSFGLISCVRDKLDQLRRGGFHLSDRDYQRILQATGEN